MLEPHMDDRGGPDRARTSGTTHVLAVYALPDCPGWIRAMTIAAQILDAGIPGVDVRLIDLSRVEGPPPPTVIASPTWILNGRRIALGNPDPDWLIALLGRLLEGVLTDGNSRA
jgi:hypothetical protein